MLAGIIRFLQNMARISNANIESELVTAYETAIGSSYAAAAAAAYAAV